MLVVKSILQGLSQAFNAREAIVLLTLIPLLCVGIVLAFPALTSHSHTSSEVLWEAGGIEDGSSYHNHIAPLSFAGPFNVVRQPFSALGCWDDNTERHDLNTISFPYRHCYIDTHLTGKSVSYSFHGNWPAGGKDAVRVAFSRYNNLDTAVTTLIPHGVTGNLIGIDFDEDASGGDVRVYWESAETPVSRKGTSPLLFMGLMLPKGANLVGGQAFSYTYLGFAGAPYSGFAGWGFSTDASTEDSTKWHFLTLAPHEIGHLVGLAHQVDSSDLM